MTDTTSLHSPSDEEKYTELVVIAPESLELHHISESSDRPQPTPSKDLLSSDHAEK